MADKYNYDFYLIFSEPASRYGRYSSPRVTSKKPSLKRNEIAVRMSAGLPIALFKQPSLTASIDVPEGTTLSSEISAETVSNIEEALSAVAGVDVTLEIKPAREQT